MTISDITLKYLCQKYRHEIGAGKNKSLPDIKVRYVAEAKEFGYAYFGNFFFYEDDFYVWEQDEKYEEDHNPEVVEDVFGNECKRQGYARRVLFAGVKTPFKDSNGENIYTGDVIQIEKDQERTEHLAVGAWSHEDGEGQYCFILDNHNWDLEDCIRLHYRLTRVGTVFYRLNPSDYVGVNQRTMEFNGWRDTEEERKEKVIMAQYTPNFDQEFWKYSALEILGVEYDWR
ncbi:MAG: hypothetical protein IKX36_03070 [Prevotella sp.]|nr:hypothetical protein [Prevotella sp.]